MKNILTWHISSIHRSDREMRQNHRSAAIFLTGLSGAGKSTIANALELALFRKGANTYVLDGDNIRHGLCSDLTFSLDDRAENIRRVGETAKLFVDAGVIVMAAFISPLQDERDKTRALFQDGEFFEVYCSAPISVCESRDTKGLYKMARAGKIKNFTGVSSPYEPPRSPDLVIDTENSSIEECVQRTIEMLSNAGVIG